MSTGEIGALGQIIISQILLLDGSYLAGLHECPHILYVKVGADEF